jgi:hypothetical protein
MTQDEIDRVWSDQIGATAADALMDAGLITKIDLDKARKIIAEEISVRLVARDKPDTENWRYKSK